MTIDPGQLGARSEPRRRSWSSTDSLLYSVSVGAGHDPVRELAFTTENSEGVSQRALPTMAVVLDGFGNDLREQLGDFDRALMLHGTQQVHWHREIPVAGEIESVSEIVGIFDKGTAALVEIETKSVLLADGEPLFDTTHTLFLRGEGGWGGERGSRPRPPEPPDRPPDQSVTYATRPEQALIYRLNFDRNPLHSDPSFSALGGYELPILHGLCTYGFTGRALLDVVADGDPAAIRSMEARFTSPVTPGEQITVEMWNVADGSTTFRTVGSDGRLVIDSGLCHVS